MASINSIRQQKAFKQLGACTRERLLSALKSDDPNTVAEAEAEYEQLKAAGITGRTGVTVVMQRSQLRYLDKKTLAPRYIKPKVSHAPRQLTEAELQPARESFGTRVESGVSGEEPAHAERPRGQRRANGKKSRKAMAGKS